MHTKNINETILTQARLLREIKAELEATRKKMLKMQLEIEILRINNDENTGIISASSTPVQAQQ